MSSARGLGCGGISLSDCVPFCWCGKSQWEDLDDQAVSLGTFLVTLVQALKPCRGLCPFVLCTLCSAQNHKIINKHCLVPVRLLQFPAVCCLGAWVVGINRLCSATFEQLLTFCATFCSASNLEQLLPSLATFEQQIGIKLIQTI